MKRDKHLDTALEALHVAAKAIRQMAHVSSCTADNDNDSGEIIFTVSHDKDPWRATTRHYVLTLAEARN